jgi:hypothetical protein
MNFIFAVVSRCWQLSRSCDHSLVTLFFSFPAGGGRPRHTIRPGEGKGLAAGSPHKVSRTDGSPAQLRKSKSVKIISEDGKEGGGDGGGSGAEDSKAAPKLARSSSSKKFFSFRKYMDSEEANELPTLLRAPPPAMFNPGRPVRSRDVGKTISIPNLKNMGVRPIRTSISSQKDSAQHLMYLRIATPFDPPDERPYSILKVGQDYIDEGKRVRAKRQHAQYKFVSVLLSRLVDFVDTISSMVCEIRHKMTCWYDHT